MQSAWVGFDQEICPENIIESLKERFNLSACYEYKIETLSELLNELKLSDVQEDESIAFYEVMRNESEFPVIWEFI